MENYEQQIIISNLSKLLQSVHVNPVLLARLEETNILGPSDIEQIDSKIINSDKAKCLLEILKTRMGAFPILIHVLHCENQTGALEALTQKIIGCSSANVVKNVFVDVEKEIGSFIIKGLKDNAKTSALLFTESTEYSLQRLQEHLNEKSFRYKENAICCGDKKCTDSLQPILGKMKKWIHFTCYNSCLTLLNANFYNLETFSSFHKIRDRFSWSILSENKQKCLLEQNIMFQKRTWQLGSIINMISGITSTSGSSILENIEERFLIELLDNKEPEIASGNIPNLPENYIPRRLISRQRISKRVIGITKESRRSDVLVYKGDNFLLYHLASMVGKYGDKMCDESKEQLKNDTISVNNILLNKDDDFEEIFNKLENDRFPIRSVHLFECRKVGTGEGAKDFSLYWIRTLGSIMQLQMYVHKNLEEIHENELIKFASRSICIADSPGMGKTCLLAKCADELIKQPRTYDSFCYVQYFTMSNFINTYRSLSNEIMTEKNLREETIVESLIISSSEFSIGREYVRSVFEDVIKLAHESAMKIHLMIDGIDELSKESYRIAQIVIEYIRSFAPITLWVATRPQSIHEIEETMSVLGFTIQPFNKEDQVNLFTNCWGGSKEMVNLANKCIDKFNKTLNLTGDSKDIVGLPLLCALLARIYEKEARKVQSAQQFEDIITHLTIDKIYETYVDGKFETSDSEDQHVEVNIAYLRHFEIALAKACPDLGKFDGYFTNLSQINDRDLLKYGLLEFGSATEPFRFVHFTIAQFIAAQSIMYILKNYSHFQDGKFKKLVRQVLRVKNSSTVLSDVGVKKYEILDKQFVHPNVCFFLNNALKINKKLRCELSDNTPGPSSQLELNIVDALTKLDDDEILLLEKTLNRLAAATKSNFSNISHILIQALTVRSLDDSLHDLIPKPVITGLIFLASKFSSFELAKKVFDLVQKWNNKVPISSYWMCELSISDINNSEIDLSDVNQANIIPSDFSFIYSDNKPSQTLANSDLLISDNVSRVLTPLHCAIESGNYVLTCHLLSTESIQTNDETHQSQHVIVPTNENIENDFGLQSERLQVLSDSNSRRRLEANDFQELSETISGGGCVKEHKPIHYNFRYLLHYCLLNTLTNPPNIIHKKKSILRYFQEQIPYLINDNPACVGICLERTHLKLLTYYLKVKHELNPEWHFLSTNKYGENMLHLLAAGHYDNDMTPEKYHKALVKLENIGINVGRHLIQYNHMHWRAVDVAVGSMNLLDKTFKMFSHLRVKFDFVDFRGSTTLFKAVSGQRNGQVLQKLIDSGATYRPKYFGETVLHTAATFYNFDAMHFFVTEHLFVDIQPKTSEKYSNFHNSLTNSNSKHFLYHLEKVQYYLQQPDVGVESLEPELSKNLEHLMYQLEYLPYNLEHVRHHLTQLLFSPKGFVYNAQEYLIYKKHLLHTCNHLLNKLSKSFQGSHKKSFVVNVQNDEGNTPLHMCFSYKKERPQLKKINSLHLGLENNESIKAPETSSPVKRRFEGTNLLQGSDGSRRNSVELDVIDADKISQIETQLTIQPLSQPSLITSSDQLRRISLYQEYFDLEPDNQHKIISLLIENGADISLSNKDLITPMDLAIELCLNGLVNEEHEELLLAQNILFSDPKYMSLALKGLLLNLKLGYIWHPNLIRTFADAIRTHEGDVSQKNDIDGASLLHLAAKKHSLFGIKYLIEQRAIPISTLDFFGKNALEYMTCDVDNCEIRNCKDIRKYLKDELTNSNQT